MNSSRASVVLAFDFLGLPQKQILTMRKTQLKRSRPKKTNPARRRKNHLRAYGPPGYVEWCKVQTCVGCRHSSICDVAHIRTGGTGRKDDWVRTVPLCSRRAYRPGCHALLHVGGREWFEKTYGIDFDVEAAKTQSAWLSSCGAPGGQT